MEISDELIACYVEGTCSSHERDEIRNYLAKHPEEYERILCLLDRDKDDFDITDEADIKAEVILNEADSFADIAMSAAAFAPNQSKFKMKPSKHEKSKLLSNLDTMLGELDKL